MEGGGVQVGDNNAVTYMHAMAGSMRLQCPAVGPLFAAPIPIGFCEGGVSIAGLTVVGGGGGGTWQRWGVGGGGTGSLSSCDVRRVLCRGEEGGGFFLC